MKKAIARKIRQYTMRRWRVVLEEIYNLPLRKRLRIAWAIVRAKKKKHDSQG